jgi:ABC-type sugar transport system ATPase subunit
MIHIQNLLHRVGNFQLGPVDLEIDKGTYLVIMGPPGSGKSVFLECLCGLRPLSTGQISIDGIDVTNLEPRIRRIGYVPQDYALFPHLSVEQNIAFGLNVNGFSHQEILSRVGKTTAMLGIQSLLPRNVTTLSGGEKQRVALARALVMEPKVLLLDEPVCALDEATRQSLCAMLHRIQRQLGLTTIHVSHNLEEVFSVADVAAILYQGTMQQIGPVSELLRRPQSEFVAGFMRCENILTADVVNACPEPQSSMVMCGRVPLIVGGQHHGRIKFVVRPENILLLGGQEHTNLTKNILQVKLISWHDYGNYIRLLLKGPIEVVAHVSHKVFAELQPHSHNELIAILPKESIHVLSE